jgi:hypothetical protein
MLHTQYNTIAISAVSKTNITARLCSHVASLVYAPNVASDFRLKHAWLGFTVFENLRLHKAYKYLIMSLFLAIRYLFVLLGVHHCDRPQCKCDYHHNNRWICDYVFRLNGISTFRIHHSAAHVLRHDVVTSLLLVCATYCAAMLVQFHLCSCLVRLMLLCYAYRLQLLLLHRAAWLCADRHC